MDKNQVEVTVSKSPIRRLSSNEFILRAITGIILAPLTLGVYYLGNVALLVSVLVLTIIVSWEFYSISIKAGYMPLRMIGILTAVLFVLGAYFRVQNGWLFILVLFITTPFWASRTTSPTNLSLANWALTIAGFLYSGGLLQYIILLRNSSEGLIFGVITLLGTWATDTFAYLTGKYFGKHKFFPNISPKKTWEGTIGGVICGFSIIFLVGSIANIPIVQRIPLGVIIPICAICGDLTESFFKRTAGIKDSGNLIPGHGGLLDRIDSLIFAFTAVYFYNVFVFSK